MFVIIEKWPDPTLVVDFEGRAMTFDTKDLAQKEADKLQNSQVVEL